jgi:hypothetical protein
VSIGSNISAVQSTSTGGYKVRFNAQGMSTD